MTFRKSTYKFTFIAALAAILVLSSCSEEAATEPFDMEKIPTQTVRDMLITKSDRGRISMRMTAPLMQHFEFRKDSMDQSYDYYPEGIFVRAYTEDGALETTITADEAKHVTTRGHDLWSAFGNVVVINIIKNERMESDTIYWNQESKKIYTDCYVKITSDSGLMQGYGMESDEKARNSKILKPFDSYSIKRDSNYVRKDTLNFIGPLK